MPEPALDCRAAHARRRVAARRSVLDVFGGRFIAFSGVAVLSGLVMFAFVRQSLRRTCHQRTQSTAGGALLASVGFVPIAIATIAPQSVSKEERGDNAGSSTNLWFWSASDSSTLAV
jgi:hypothetical protein